MGGLPAGTVTLLFADVEGSTRAVRDLGDEWPNSLDVFRGICRRAWADFDGHEMGTEGDSFFVVFAAAADGVHAAMQVQFDLGRAEWPSKYPLKARIGIHTGSPQRHSDGYVGIDVHKAARVAGVVHGGQVVVSEATKHLAEPHLKADLDLLNLGEHRLKDIPGRLRLFQLTAPDLEREFPTVRSRGAAGSLPRALTPTVGRDGELTELRDLILDDHARLVTLTGPGGSGKTRLATTLAGQIAGTFSDGVFLIELATVTTAMEVWSTIAQLLDVPADGHIPPGFFDYAAHRNVLLVMDNLEQIPDIDDVVRQLLESAEHITILATSRRPLHVQGEYEHVVPPLLLPAGDSFDAIGASGAVQMFVENAARVRRGFSLTEANAGAVAQLAVALDGLPLALELAAARVKVLSPAAILARIDQSLDISSDDRSRTDRQRTLRGAIEWSFDLLEEPHQRFLFHLSVFEGGATAEAIEQVLGPLVDLGDESTIDALVHLVDASLITVIDPDEDEPRFSQLETIKQFCAERLAADRLEVAAAHRSHAQYFYDLASERVYALMTDSYAEARQLFARELDNFRVVAERRSRGVSDSAYGDRAVPPEHVEALLAFLAYRFHRNPLALVWCDRSLAAAPEWIGSARLLMVRGKIHSALGDRDSCILDTKRAIEIYQEHRDEVRSKSLPEWIDPARTEIQSLIMLAYSHLEQGELEQIQPLLTEANHLVASLEPSLRAEVEHLGFVLAREVRKFDLAKVHLEAAGSFWSEAGLTTELLYWENAMADLDLQQGLRAQAQRRLSRSAEAIINRGDVYDMALAASTFAQAINRQHPLICARVFASVSTLRETEGMPAEAYLEVEAQRILGEAEVLCSSEDWEKARALGRHEAVADLFREMAALPIPPEASGT